MKKFLLAAAGLLLALAVSAQDHLLFEGIPLEGDYPTFARQMRKKHFRYASKDHNEPFMTGKVLGVKSDLTIYITPKSYDVYMVAVSYPVRKGWESLRNQYESTKMKLHARYGAPTMNLETFTSPFAANDPIAALAEGECTWISTYKAPGGEIILSLSQDARVQIFYMDEVGMAAANAEQ